MGKIRCELCDGLIVNERCQDCGMDYSRRKIRYQLNVTRREDNAAAVRKVSQTSRQQNQKQNQDKDQKERQKARNFHKKQHKYYSSNFGKEKKKNRAGVLAAVLAVIFIVLGAFSQMMSERHEKTVTTGQDDYSFDTNLIDSLEDYDYSYDYNYDADADVSEDYDYSEDLWTTPTPQIMPESGEEFSAELTPGRYVGGQHLPVGTYTIRLVSNTEYDLGGIVELDDDENGIFESEFMAADGEYGVTGMENCQLFEGGVLDISGDIKVVVSSENAQLDDMTEGTANPLTESFELSYGDVLQVGTDIPAGVYDASWISGFGTLELTDDSGGYYDSVMVSDNGTGNSYSNRYDNMLLTEGQKITVPDYSSEDFTVSLSPSEIIYETGSDA
ncbi:MAG: hypothetical protein ACOX8E_06070 [Ruminococcus sp.]